MREHSAEALPAARSSESAQSAKRDNQQRPAPPSPHGRVWPLERWFLQRALALMENPPVEIELWNGERVYKGEDPPKVTVRINSHRALFKVLLSPERYFGDFYMNRQVEVIGGDVLDLLFCLYRHAPHGRWRQRPNRFSWRSTIKSRRNTLRAAKQNIHHHYDIGNAFYELWLDKHMQYTCAYFPEAEMSLEQAQEAKMEHVCRKLQLQPGQTVVEAGCGWGGLARYMARHYDVQVKSYNISHQQINYARQRAMEEGVADRVQYVEDDYRNIDGTFDAFVSVGMLEHVGTENYRELSRVINRCLAPNGRGLIHTIGRNRPRPMNPWIDRRIFPGAHPPSLSEMMKIFEPAEFSVLDVENLRLHYEKTLRHWLSRYDAAGLQIRGMFDDEFVRTWRLYLSGSIVSFHIGELQLFQVVFARKKDNTIPWNRAHLYQ